MRINFSEKYEYFIWLVYIINNLLNMHIIKEKE